MEMGFIPGEEILVVKNAPLRDPVEYRILNYDVTLRRSEAENVEVEPLHDKSKDCKGTSKRIEINEQGLSLSNTKRIKVAFVGNPNSGKTSLFNAASGAHEHVGNYSGVTVEAKRATYTQGGYTFELIDLPGAYSLSSYSPEERYINEYLMGDERPDVILDVVDSTNLERHLYMTTQLLETGIPVVVALNMWDEMEHSGSRLDLPGLSNLFGVPLSPTVGRTGKGISQLFEHITSIYQRRSQVHRVIDVRYSPDIEEAITCVADELSKDVSYLPRPTRSLRPRFLAIKLLEEETTITEALKALPDCGTRILSVAQEAAIEYERRIGNDIQHDITNGRYGFVRGALQETYLSDYSQLSAKNHKIDHLLTHKIWGLPIFILSMYLMFQLTFTLGEYPMMWIESGVGMLAEWVSNIMQEGMLRDLIVDGVIAGVGGVLVFLPNIVILYLCLSVMEDTGYMARAAFIMDRLMHIIGLHGKSFIPLVMGFGCNVPAVMATRTIENWNNRLVTMLIIPFMSCSAKLPVYLLLAGAFFPDSAGFVLFLLYFTGIIVAIISALIFKKSFNTTEETPFVMELPPYRVPTLRSILRHMWERSKQYLHKMGSVILVASIAIWALSYFPRIDNLHPHEIDELIANHLSEVGEQEVSDFMTNMNEEAQMNMLQQENSWIGQIGHSIQSIFALHGYDWRMSVSLLTGVAAKEIVVSTLGVLYTGNSEDGEVALTEKLQSASYPDGSRVIDPAIAFSFMIFVLIYIPCISTAIAIGRESSSWKYALFSILYSISLAWVLGLAISQIGHLIL